MIFQEKAVANAWEYKIEDVFGVMEFYSDTKIPVTILDDMVLLLLRQNLSAETVTGEVKTDQGIVRYTFTKESLWGDVSKEEESEWDEPGDLDICKNTPISTRGPESVFTLIRHWISRTLKKLRKSVAVIRDIWKNPQE